MKTARDYYLDVFDGVRLTVCGLVMLFVCAGKAVVRGTCYLFHKKDDKTLETIDAEYTEVDNG